MKTAKQPDSTGQHAGRGKCLILTFVIAAGVIGLCYGAWYAVKPVAAATTAPVPVGESVVIPVEGMSCSSCVARVKSTLKELDGVSDANVSLEHREAGIRYDPAKVSPAKLAEAIDDLGYQAGLPREKNANQ